MSYIDIYETVRGHWENDTSGQSTSPSQNAFGNFTLNNGVLSATIGSETKTVDLRPLIPSPVPDLHLKSVTPSADGSKLIFKIGEAGNTSRDKEVELNFKEQIVKLVGTPPAPYDDAELKRRIAALEAAQQAGGSGAKPFKEYEAKYIPRSELGELENNTFKQITFSKQFSKKPFVSVTLDFSTTSPRFTYLANITETGFQFTANYAPDVQGIWYQAYIVE